MKLVLNQMLSSFDAEVGLIIIAGSRGLKEEVSVGIEIKDLSVISQKHTGSTLLNDISARHMPWFLNQPQLQEEYDISKGQRNILNLLSAPILVKSKVIGYLVLVNKISDDDAFGFTSEDMEIISLFVHQIGGVIESSRLYSNMLKLNNYTESLLNGLNAGLLTIERTGIIKYANSLFETYSGYKSSELINQNMNFLFKLEKDKYADFLNMVTGRSKIPTIEMGMTRKDGTQFLVEMSSSAIQNVQTSKIELILMITDITEKRELEKELQKSRHLSTLGTLSAEIVHELKNPLSAIKGYVDMMPKKIEDPKFISIAINVITEEIDKLFSTVKLLLTFSKGKSENMKEMDPDKAIEKVLLLIDEEAKKQETKIIRTQGEPALILGDANQIQQILLNIIQNSLQALESGGSVTIESGVTVQTIKNSENKNFYYINIIDSGPGMPQEVIEKIFTPFFTTKAAGTGLGLSICYKMIEEHHGKIEVKSVIGSGTTFTILLPIYQNAN